MIGMWRRVEEGQDSGQGGGAEQSGSSAHPRWFSADSQPQRDESSVHSGVWAEDEPRRVEATDQCLACGNDSNNSDSIYLPRDGHICYKPDECSRKCYYIGFCRCVS